MGFKQSPFPMIDGTTGHKKELTSPAKISYPSSSQTGPHGPTGTKDIVGKYHYKKYLKDAAKKSTDPYFKDVMDKKTFQKSTTAKTVKPKQVTTQIVKKVAKKSLSRVIPVIGEALMVGDIVKRGIKNIKEGKQTLYKEAKGTGGKTWAERKKESKSNVWDKK